MTMKFLGLVLLMLVFGAKGEGIRGGHGDDSKSRVVKSSERRSTTATHSSVQATHAVLQRQERKHAYEPENSKSSKRQGVVDHRTLKSAIVTPESSTRRSTNKRTQRIPRSGRETVASDAALQSKKKAETGNVQSSTRQGVLDHRTLATAVVTPESSTRSSNKRTTRRSLDHDRKAISSTPQSRKEHFQGPVAGHGQASLAEAIVTPESSTRTKRLDKRTGDVSHDPVASNGPSRNRQRLQANETRHLKSLKQQNVLNEQTPSTEMVTTESSRRRRVNGVFKRAPPDTFQLKQEMTLATPFPAWSVANFHSRPLLATPSPSPAPTSLAGGSNFHKHGNFNTFSRPESTSGMGGSVPLPEFEGFFNRPGSSSTTGIDSVQQATPTAPPTPVPPPTSPPTFETTKKPSLSPTVQPTLAPTSGATPDAVTNSSVNIFDLALDTAQPTTSPTPEPTEIVIEPEPADTPTLVPTPGPTEIVIEPEPTVTPTLAPTPGPTEIVMEPEPADTPTLVPTPGPTEIVMEPEPADTPALVPTSGPTEIVIEPEPTVTPTLAPTPAPTEIVMEPEPADTPSLTPTPAPTEIVIEPGPADTPTLSPTQAPTEIVIEPEPADTPTLSPTPGPTEIVLEPEPPTLAPTLPLISANDNAPSTASSDHTLDVLLKVALKDGSEFESPESYQSKAYSWLKDFESESYSDWQIIQRYALACIYFATNAVSTIYTDGGTRGVLGWVESEYWLTLQNECEWAGVVCNADLRVTGLQLYSNRITGEFPSEVILLNETLEELDLFNNPVHKAAEEQDVWENLRNLKYLYIASTYFMYRDGIPPGIGKLSNLIELDIAYTLFSGWIDGSVFADLPSLSTLVMGHNNWDSRIPEELALLPNLQYLYMENANLGGDLEFLAKLPKIVELWMEGNNDVDGDIPAGIGNVTTLESLSIADLSLTGPLPAEMGQLLNLRELWVYGNFIEGQVPTEFENLLKLEVFEMYRNNLTGIPEEVCELKSLGTLMFLTADCEEIKCTCCDECYLDGAGALVDNENKV